MHGRAQYLRIEVQYHEYVLVVQYCASNNIHTFVEVKRCILYFTSYSEGNVFLGKKAGVHRYVAREPFGDLPSLYFVWRFPFLNCVLTAIAQSNFPHLLTSQSFYIRCSSNYNNFSLCLSADPRSLLPAIPQSSKKIMSWVTDLDQFLSPMSTLYLTPPSRPHWNDSCKSITIRAPATPV